MTALAARAPAALPQPAAMLQLLKPITWFAAMWAFACGIVSSGAPILPHLLTIAGGVLLAGPLVCGTSQIVNDWFDRHVDAINEPGRPIPSGRVPGRWALFYGIAWTLLSLLVAAALGRWTLLAASIGLALAWAYSAPPLRLKLNGWWGNAACGLCYEGLPWFTAAAIMQQGRPDGRIIALALLYSAGAHGIMTLNDFKSVAGDRAMGVRSLPVQLGERSAARLACLVMAAPQLVVIALLLAWGTPITAAVVTTLLAAQLLCMVHFLADPPRRAIWYNSCGTTLYVFGMMACAIALRVMA